MDSFREINLVEELESLREALYSGEALYFVGAGCSQGLGFPGWGDLIEDLVKKFAPNEINYDDNSDYLDLASQVKKLLGTDRIDQYHAILHSTFRQPPMRVGFDKTDTWPKESKLHSAIFQFPIKAVVTTNYDHAIQHYLRELGVSLQVKNVMPYEGGPVGNFLFSLKDKGIFRSVLHLHGDHESAQNIILDRDDYNKVYKTHRDEQTNSHHRKILWTLLTTRCLIFIGFSLSDKYLNEILREVCRDVLGSFQKRHFAIFPYEPENKDILNDQREKFFRDYSIQTIFYNSRNKHEELVDLLRFLKDKPQEVDNQNLKIQMAEDELAAIKIKMKAAIKKAVR